MNTLYSVPPIPAPMFISYFVFHDPVSRSVLFIMKMFCSIAGIFWYRGLNLNIYVESIMVICYHSVQNILSSRLLSKNLKTKIYRTIILPVVLYGCETWSLTRREERKLKVFENMVLRRIFGPRRDEVTGNGGDCITRS